MANRRARVLLAHGIGPDDVVAVAMVRSVEQMATVHGILKAGAAYLPIDVDAPADRIATIVSEARVRCAVTDPERLAWLRTTIRPVACLDLTARGLRHIADGPVPPSELRGRVHPGSLAYVLFTSGSTGRPKGVQITQRALVNQVRWIADEHDIDADDVVLLKTPFTFDASVWEMFTPALVGATTVVAGPRRTPSRRDGRPHRPPRRDGRAVRPVGPRGGRRGRGRRCAAIAARGVQRW